MRRSVTYACGAGLANRLRLHVIALAYAIRTGRELLVGWQRNEYCYATYRDLFSGGPREVADLPMAQRLSLELASQFSRHVFRRKQNETGADDLPDPPHRVVHFEPSIGANLEGRDRVGVHREAVRKSLTPIAGIVEAANSYRNRFPGPAIGVHVRAGDFADKYGADLPPIEWYATIVRRISARRPETVFLVSSDADEAGLRPLLEAGECRIRPTTGARTSREGVRDALADMVILGSTQGVIGTPLSSFNVFAAWWADRPLLWVVEDWKPALGSFLDALENADHTHPRSGFRLFGGYPGWSSTGGDGGQLL